MRGLSLICSLALMVTACSDDDSGQSNNTGQHDAAVHDGATVDAAPPADGEVSIVISISL